MLNDMTTAIWLELWFHFVRLISIVFTQTFHTDSFILLGGQRVTLNGWGASTENHLWSQLSLIDRGIITAFLFLSYLLLIISIRDYYLAALEGGCVFIRHLNEVFLLYTHCEVSIGLLMIHIGVVGCQATCRFRRNLHLSMMILLIDFLIHLSKLAKARRRCLCLIIWCLLNTVLVTSTHSNFSRTIFPSLRALAYLGIDSIAWVGE